MNRKAEGFDVIGDVHGCAAKLESLLRALDYTDQDGAYRHTTRQAVFVGDLIDGGPEQSRVLQIVRAMATAGSAQVVMGNHEFNAIAYATPTPDEPGEFLRPHTKKNDDQHKEFIGEIGFRTADHDEIIEWFKTLPLWLDLDGLRVVHACWDPYAMAGLGTPHLDTDAMVAASTKDSDEYRWVEHLCKGPEVPLPENHSFTDNYGHERTDARFRWWDPTSATYASGCEVPPSCSPPLPDTLIPNLPVEPYNDDVPVIFGHFWREWPTFELTNTTACVDYSAVRGGPLVAYRWSGESKLTTDRLTATQGLGHS